MSKQFKEIETLEEPDALEFKDTAKQSRSESYCYGKPARCFFENTSKEEVVL